jgi:hypothetical protein
VMALSPASARRSSITAAARLFTGSTVKLPIWSSSRADQAASSCAPGCRIGASRREAPPRTTPRCRPWPSVNSSTMAALSPCRRTLRSVPSSRHPIMGAVSGRARGRQAEPWCGRGVFRLHHRRDPMPPPSPPPLPPLPQPPSRLAPRRAGGTPMLSVAERRPRPLPRRPRRPPGLCLRDRDVRGGNEITPLLACQERCLEDWPLVTLPAEDFRWWAGAWTRFWPSRSTGGES